MAGGKTMSDENVDLSLSNLDMPISFESGVARAASEARLAKQGDTRSCTVPIGGRTGLCDVGFVAGCSVSGRASPDA